MPGLPVYNVKPRLSHHKTITGQRTTVPEPLPPLDMGDSIKYIPSQIDPFVGASTRAAHRQNPIRLMVKDTGVLLRSFSFIPNIVSPLITRDKDSELYPSLENVKIGLLQALLALIQSLFLVVVIPAFLLLPGAVFLGGTALCCLTCYLITLPMQGPSINFANMDDATRALAAQHEDERWVFVNGICTG